jgi:hypothetical protein
MAGSDAAPFRLIFQRRYGGKTDWERWWNTGSRIGMRCGLRVEKKWNVVL